MEQTSKSFSKGSQRSWPWQVRKRDGNGHGHDQREVRAIDQVSLAVRQGEIFGVLGANGSGKSTLIRLISTLLIPDDGTITVFGHDVRRDEMAVKRLINRVSVDAALFKKLSAIENLTYAARLYGLNARQAQEQAIGILERLGIKSDRVRDPLEDMSRGMQQKVAIARALLTTPVLLLLDEPTTGLDPRSKREVQQFVLELREVHDTTVVLTTHDMDEADRLCDRIAILDEGKIVALDTPAGLKAMVGRTNGHEPTMEEAFMALTGKRLVDGEEDVEEEPVVGHVL
ncbi:MAG: ABC transporter ATP-binding protein [Anaerolineae bacterium]|nr:MAG: ABC transporter ATP-binding protein [Anaerolineae bacterium]